MWNDSYGSWWQGVWRSQAANKRRSKPRCARARAFPALEELESRLAPAVFVLNTSLAPSNTVPAGQSFILTVQAQDGSGNNISMSGSVNLTTTDPNVPMLPAITLSNGFGYAADNLQTAGGPWTINAMSGAVSGTSAGIQVTAGPAERLAFGVQPTGTVTGNLISPAVTVQVVDQYGNVVTSDNTDHVTVGIGSGPGTFTASSTTTATVHNGVASFPNLTLIQPGSYTLSDTVPAEYLGPNSNAFSVAPLQIVPGSFASSPSGFSLQFNAPYLVTSTTPVLYGSGFGATAPVPSVTLTGPAGLVEGSLVLNTATDSITFLATDTALETNSTTSPASPILPDGTYTAVVRSSAATNGFQALNSGGGFLDGLASGTPGSGDFTKTFTVGAAAAGDDVVWGPATADGPGQPLNAPGTNQSGGGYPIYINDSYGTVTNVQLTLNYNASLLTVTGATSNSNLPGSSFTLNTGLSTPGHAVLQYSDSGANSANLKGAQIPLGFLTASVPSGTTANPTPYRAKDVLHLSGVSINSGAIPVTTNDGLHLVAYVGDGDGNGGYSSNDAVLITRVALQTDSGFTAYPLVDPVIVADTDGAGFIPADAPLQANEAGVGFPTANLAIPPVPANVHFQVIANNVDPMLSIQGSGVRGQGSGGTVTVSVNIDDADPAGSTGLTEAHLALTYDPSLFTVSATDVHLGSVLTAGSGWTVAPTIDPATGQIAIALSSDTPISSSLGGSLVTIDFHQLSGEPGGVSPRSAISLVASVNPNGQYVTTELEDAQGTFTLTPAPTNSSDPAMDRVVMLAASPAATSMSSVAGSAPVVATTALVEAQNSDSSALESQAGETPNPNLPALAPEPMDQEILVASSASADAAMVHVSVATVHAAAGPLVSTSMGPLAAAPLSGLVFQLASTATVSVQASTGLSAWQHVADQLFQALVRVPGNATDSTLAGSMQDAWERVLARQLLSVPLATDDLEDLNWNEVATDLDGLGLGQAPGLL